MGIKVKTVEEVTCDLCGNDCRKGDGKIEIQINNGDGRDVGPGFIRAEFRSFQPYGVNDGIVCAPCKMKWLRKYVEMEGMA